MYKSASTSKNETQAQSQENSCKVEAGYVNISSLKRWARDNLSHKSTLRSMILLEKDHLTVEEFLAKTDTYQKLCRIEKERRSI